MESAIIAIVPKDTGSLTTPHWARLETLAHCYVGRRIPVAGVDFSRGVFVVAFDRFDEEKRWEVVSRLSQHMPIYSGLSTTQIYNAGIEGRLLVSIEHITLLTPTPIPDDILRKAIA